MRIGIGYDAHRFVSGRKLILGGVEVPYEKGLEGHSDADVLLHAITDALLGAAGLGDIGKLFPDTDERYKGISSLLILKKVSELLKNNGYIIQNIDTVVVLQNPKIARFYDEMRANISEALGVPVEKVSIKATTTEKMGFEGRGEGVSAQAAVLLEDDTAKSLNTILKD